MIELITIDSTNNYAMQLIDADKAHHGMTITALTQSGGKGQRSNSWADTFGQSLLMSVIIEPQRLIKDQFTFNTAMAAAVAEVLKAMHEDWRIHIKWPNDIIVNDKKAGGMLIENVLRGSKWSNSVIGIGLNVQQDKMPDNLPFATSLRLASGRVFDIKELRDEIRDRLLKAVDGPVAAEEDMKSYNQFLYKRKKKQKLNTGAAIIEATIIQVHADGKLEVQLPDGKHEYFQHGQVTWVWE